MKHLLGAVALLAALAPAADAAVYTRVLPEKSSIEFSYSQMGVPMDGRFRRFSGELSFDPAQPSAAKVSIDVDLASIDTGMAELDSEAAGRDWFNLKSFPTARFDATGAKPLGGNRYSVAGKLTIKGRSRDVTVPATFTPQGASGVFAGQFTLKRGDFAIGEGAWSAFDIVANDVVVKFRLAASGQ